jgi:hypothetical protein
VRRPEPKGCGNRFVEGEVEASGSPERDPVRGSPRWIGRVRHRAAPIRSAGTRASRKTFSCREPARRRSRGERATLPIRSSPDSFRARRVRTSRPPVTSSKNDPGASTPRNEYTQSSRRLQVSYRRAGLSPCGGGG